MLRLESSFFYFGPNLFISYWFLAHITSLHEFGYWSIFSVLHELNFKTYTCKQATTERILLQARNEVSQNILQIIINFPKSQIDLITQLRSNDFVKT